MGRAPCCDKANVKKGPWSPEEDAKLKAYIEQHGTGGNWIALPQKIGLKRCGKSCRLRWLNYLRPNIKHGGFSEEEDNIICSLYISIGSRWSIIAAQLPGRTDNDIKNYWNTKLKKKLLGRRKETQIHRLSTLSQDTKEANGVEESAYSQPLSNSALERLELHMQLQILQHPFSFYNNPALWPKLHSFGGRTSQSNNGQTSSPTCLMQQVHNNQTRESENVGVDELSIALMQQGQAKSTTNSPKQHELENSFNVSSSSDCSIDFSCSTNPVTESITVRSNGIKQSNVEFQTISGLQAELNDLLSFRYEDQISEFDCFKEIDGSKDSLNWWSGNFDAKLSSSNSWDSASSIPTEGMFQDDVLGFDL